MWDVLIHRLTACMSVLYPDLNGPAVPFVSLLKCSVSKSPCKSTVHIRDNAIVSDLCNSWVHIRCNWLDKKDYKAFLDDPGKSFLCLRCLKDIMPFSKLGDNEFELISSKGENFSYNFNNNDAQSPIKQLMYDRINN